MGTLVKAIVVLLLLTAGVFLVRSYWINIAPILKEVLSTLRETRLRYVFLAISVYLLSVYLFSVRWQQVLSCIGYDLKATSLVPIYFGAVFINNVTPGGNMAGGESFRILWANKLFGISYTNAFKTIFFERLVEAIPVAFLSIYILDSFPSLEVRFLPHSLTLRTIHLFFLVFLAAVILILVFRAKFVSLVKIVQQNWNQFKKSLIPVLLLSCGVWVLDVIRLKSVALALNIHLSLSLIITISILSFLLGALPLTPGGLGIIEGGLISLLLYFGLSLASASSFVLLERFISYGISSIIGFLYLSYYGGFKIWKKSKEEKLN
ncbi:lysylphosphatidylglycerol synthase transmembrane domain-containing protein [Methanosarcina sp. UBA5]|uniref:lysylphosphatidylglycerol synthase transmembrane domain-containing protein n=1 Tax=Methanosarcina sp. UBA5 TaxID=1915593 RepID=UPI0025E0D51A|nr:lysylphosphatidylglycerol synthase transmembrane domain-containing protein [Methanosarcina sp. UBA5]